MFLKKGQVNEQFNWIFAIVAGGIILMFFLFFIAQIKTTSDAKLSITVLNNFDAILTGSSVTPNSLNIIDSSKMLEFDVSCEEDGLSELTLTDSTSRIDLSRRMLYSPSLSSGQRLYLYVLPIERPFDLGNALLLTGDNTLFAIYDSTGNPGMDELYELLPSNISKEKVTSFSSDQASFDKIVVFSEESAPSLSGDARVYGASALKKSDVTWIQLDFYGSNQIKSGSVYKKEHKDPSFEFVGDTNLPSLNFAMLLGFSKDLDFYECNMNKINLKMRVVSNIYLKRALSLENTVSNINCQGKYLSAENVLREMVKPNSGYNNIDLVDRLSEINHGLLLNSCPLVY